MQTTALSNFDESVLYRHHSIRGSMQRLFREAIFRTKQPRATKPPKPLISRNSNNVFHDQALMQLVGVYESLQLGDSPEATATVYATGVRIFGQEAFERAIQYRNAGRYS